MDIGINVGASYIILKDGIWFKEIEQVLTHFTKELIFTFGIEVDGFLEHGDKLIEGNWMVIV